MKMFYGFDLLEKALWLVLIGLLFLIFYRIFKSFLELLKKKDSLLTSEKRFYFVLILIIISSLLLSVWIGLLGNEKYLNRESIPIIGIIFGSLEFWGINQLVVCVFGWVHFRTLKDVLGNSAKEKQLVAVRYGTLILAAILEIISLIILYNKPIPLIIIIYTLPLTLISFILVLLVAKILVSARFKINI